MSDATRARLAAMLADEPLDLAEANLLISARPRRTSTSPRGWRGSTPWPAARRPTAWRAALRGAGFRGDAEDYDDPRNSFLDQVLSAGAACRSRWPR